MLLHEMSFAREFQNYTVNSFRRHFEHVALLSLLSLRLFRVMAVKQKQARSTDTYVAWLISMHGERHCANIFNLLGKNSEKTTKETLSKNCANNF